ncbi:MAG: ABC transporter substrate-binding protein [Candidatus Hodarchaeales archaeon]
MTVLSIGLLLVFILAVIPVDARPAAPEKTHALPADILVGGVFPIVKRPEAGRDRRDGFLIAIEEINSQTGTDRILPAGVNMTGLVKDDNNDAAGGKFAAETLISEGAHVVIGTSGSSVSQAMAAELAPHKIVQLSYASSATTLSDRVKFPYFMRNVPSDTSQAIALADLVKVCGWTKGATINTDDSYGTGLVSVFTDVFTIRDGGTITTAQQFATGASDVASQAQAIKDSNPEFVLANMIDKDGKVLFKKAKELGLTDGGANAVPWLITDGTSTTATFEGDADVKAAMQGFIGTTPVAIQGAGYAAFNTTWYSSTWSHLAGPAVSQASGVAFNSYAPFAYDAVYVMAKGLAKAGTTEGDALLTALYTIEHEGASGSIKFNLNGEIDGRYDYVSLDDVVYTSFGTWSEGTGKGNSTSLATLTLPDGTTKTVADFTFPAQYKYEPPAAGNGAPGFTILSMFGLFAVVAVINRRRRK